MGVLIGKLEFEGPFDDALNIHEEPGLFGILCEVNGEVELIELDESDCLRTCLTSQEHVNNIHFYAETCRGKLSAVVHYTQDMHPQERRELKQQLLAELEDTTEVSNQESDVQPSTQIAFEELATHK